MSVYLVKDDKECYKRFNGIPMYMLESITAFKRMIQSLNNINAGIIHIGDEIIVSKKIIERADVSNYLSDISEFKCMKVSEVFCEGDIVYVFKKEE
jgi:hypothetical protein